MDFSCRAHNFVDNWGENRGNSKENVRPLWHLLFLTLGTFSSTQSAHSTWYSLSCIYSVWRMLYTLHCTELRKQALQYAIHSTTCSVQCKSLQYTVLDHSVVLPHQPKRDQVTFLVFPHHKQTRIFLLVTDKIVDFKEKFRLHHSK